MRNRHRTIAITGGTGFVGRHLIDAALAQGHVVRALARSPRTPRDGVAWVYGALERPRALAELVAGADAVIHVAGVVNAVDGREGFRIGNAAGTLGIVDATRAAGVRRLVHVSSLAAREPGLSDYGWSKARAETIVAASALDWTIVRPPAIYGPGDREMLELFRAARRGIVPLPPAGRLSVIAAADLARLLLAVLPDIDTEAQIYEPDDGRAGGWSHVEFAAAIGHAVGKRARPQPVPAWAMHAGARIDALARGRNAKLTPDRVRYFLHPDWVSDPARRPPAHLWRAQTPTLDGLAVAAASYREEGLLG